MNYDNRSNPLNEMKHYHLHDDYEIFYLLEGERIYLINGKRYSVGANNIVFIDKNIIHKTNVTEISNTKRIVINFHDSFLSRKEENLLNNLFNEGYQIMKIPPEKTKNIQTLIQRLHDEYYSENDYVETYLRTLLIQLLIECNRIRNQKGIKKQNGHEINSYIKQEVADIIKYINNNYNKNISLSHLSYHFNLNEQYISRIFRQFTGVTFISYLNAVRINQAKRLLLETNMKIQDVSKRVGYSNNVHLWRVFKKITGYSPNTYRELNQK